MLAVTVVGVAPSPDALNTPTVAFAVGAGKVTVRLAAFATYKLTSVALVFVVIGAYVRLPKPPASLSRRRCSTRAPTTS